LRRLPAARRQAPAVQTQSLALSLGQSRGDPPLPIVRGQAPVPHLQCRGRVNPVQAM
jgi:hypothetical protein